MVLQTEDGQFLLRSTDGDATEIGDLKSEAFVQTASSLAADHDVECAGDPLGAAWDWSRTILAVTCADKLKLVDVESGDRYEKSLPGTGLDVTNWGEGFGVLVRRGDGVVQLMRTPCHEDLQFGVLTDSLPSDAVQAVGGITQEALALLTSDGRLLVMRSDGALIEQRSGVAEIGEVLSEAGPHDCR